MWCTDDFSTLAGIAAKLWAKRAPYLLTDWRSQVRVRNVRCFDFQITKCCRGCAILSDSLETTLAYVVVARITLVICPPATSQASCRGFSILRSWTIWQRISWKFGGDDLSSFNISYECNQHAIICHTLLYQAFVAAPPRPAWYTILWQTKKWWAIIVTDFYYLLLWHLKLQCQTFFWPCFTISCNHLWRISTISWSQPCCTSTDSMVHQHLVTNKQIVNTPCYTSTRSIPIGCLHLQVGMLIVGMLILLIHQQMFSVVMILLLVVLL